MSGVEFKVWCSKSDGTRCIVDVGVSGSFHALKQLKEFCRNGYRNQYQHNCGYNTINGKCQLPDGYEFYQGVPDVGSFKELVSTLDLNVISDPSVSKREVIMENNVFAVDMYIGYGNCALGTMRDIEIIGTLDQMQSLRGWYRDFQDADRDQKNLVSSIPDFASFCSKIQQLDMSFVLPQTPLMNVQLQPLPWHSPQQLYPCQMQ